MDVVFAVQCSLACKSVCHPTPYVYTTRLLQRGAGFTVSQVCSCFKTVRKKEKIIITGLTKFWRTGKKSNDFHQLILELNMLIVWIKVRGAVGRGPDLFQLIKLAQLHLHI